MNTSIEYLRHGYRERTGGNTKGNRSFIGRFRKWISQYVVWDEFALEKDPYWPRMWVAKEDKSKGS